MKDLTHYFQSPAKSTEANIPETKKKPNGGKTPTDENSKGFQSTKKNKKSKRRKRQVSDPVVKNVAELISKSLNLISPDSSLALDVRNNSLDDFEVADESAGAESKNLESLDRKIKKRYLQEDVGKSPLRMKRKDFTGAEYVNSNDKRSEIANEPNTDPHLKKNVRKNKSRGTIASGCDGESSIERNKNDSSLSFQEGKPKESGKGIRTKAGILAEAQRNENSVAEGKLNYQQGGKGTYSPNKVKQKNFKQEAKRKSRSTAFEPDKNSAVGAIGDSPEIELKKKKRLIKGTSFTSSASKQSKSSKKQLEQVDGLRSNLTESNLIEKNKDAPENSAHQRSSELKLKEEEKIATSSQRKINENSLDGFSPKIENKPLDSANISSATKQRNAFEFMMNQRNRSIGANSPGVEMNKNELSSRELKEKKAILASRRNLFKTWSDAKGSLKRKLDEKDKDIVIERKMKKRAKRLKKLLKVEDEDDDDFAPKTKRRKRRVVRLSSDEDRSSNLEREEARKTPPNANGSSRSTSFEKMKEARKCRQITKFPSNDEGSQDSDFEETIEVGKAYQVVKRSGAKRPDSGGIRKSKKQKTEVGLILTQQKEVKHVGQLKTSKVKEQGDEDVELEVEATEPDVEVVELEEEDLVKQKLEDMEPEVELEDKGQEMESEDRGQEIESNKDVRQKLEQDTDDIKEQELEVAAKQEGNQKKEDIKLKQGHKIMKQASISSYASPKLNTSNEPSVKHEKKKVPKSVTGEISDTQKESIGQVSDNVSENTSLMETEDLSSPKKKKHKHKLKKHKHKAKKCETPQPKKHWQLRIKISEIDEEYIESKKENRAPPEVTKDNKPANQSNPSEEIIVDVSDDDEPLSQKGKLNEVDKYPKDFILENSKGFISGDSKDFISGDPKDSASGDPKDSASGESNNLVSGNSRDFKDLICEDSKAFISGNSKDLIDGDSKAFSLRDSEVLISENADDFISENSKASVLRDYKAYTLGNSKAPTLGHSKAFNSEDSETLVSGNSNAFIFGDSTSVITETSKDLISEDSKDETTNGKDKPTQQDATKDPVLHQRVLRERKPKKLDDSYVHISSDSECESEQPSRKKKSFKNMKIAPVFLKSTPKPKIDPAVLEAKRQFLHSGIPSVLRKEIDRQESLEALEVDVFPKISHVQQRTTEDIWNLPPANLPLSAPTHTDIKFQKSWCEFFTKSNIPNDAPIINASYGKTRLSKELINTIKAANPHYPVYKICKSLHGRNLPVENKAQNDRVEEKLKKKMKKRKRSNGKKAKDVELDDDVQIVEAPQENGDSSQYMMWTEKYKPNKAEEIIGNFKSTKAVKTWLQSWLEFSEESSSKGRKSAVDSEDDFTDGDSRESERIPSTLIILTGPPGSGKTSTVYAICNELGINVLELNASSRRTGKRLLQELQEATQSHQVKKDNPLGVFSQKQRLQETTNASNKMCLLLVEDADLVFESDEGFISALLQLTTISKRPVILTTTDKNSLFLAKFVSQYKCIEFAPLASKTLSVWLQLLCLAEGCFISEESLSELLDYNGGDVRKTLLELQFWVLSGGDFEKTKAKLRTGNIENIDDDASNLSFLDSNLESDIYYLHGNCRRSFEVPKLERSLLPYDFQMGHLWWNLPNLLDIPSCSSFRLAKSEAGQCPRSQDERREIGSGLSRRDQNPQRSLGRSRSKRQEVEQSSQNPALDGLEGEPSSKVGGIEDQSSQNSALGRLGGEQSSKVDHSLRSLSCPERETTKDLLNPRLGDSESAQNVQNSTGVTDQDIDQSRLTGTGASQSCCQRKSAQGRNQGTLVPGKQQSELGDKLREISQIYERLTVADVSYNKSRIGQGCEPDTKRWQDKIKDSLEVEQNSLKYDPERSCVLDWTHRLLSGSFSHYNQRSLIEADGSFSTLLPSAKEKRWREKQGLCQDLLSEAIATTNLMHPGTVCVDFLPALREMARSEKERAANNTKRNSRFYNYLKTLNVDCSEPALNLFCSTLAR